MFWVSVCWAKVGEGAAGVFSANAFGGAHVFRFFGGDFVKPPSLFFSI